MRTGENNAADLVCMYHGRVRGEARELGDVFIVDHAVFKVESLHGYLVLLHGP